MVPRASLLRVGIWPHPRTLQDPVGPQFTPYFFSRLPGAAGRNERGVPRGEAVAPSVTGGRLRGLTPDVGPELSLVPHLHEAQVRRSVSLIAM